MSMRLLTSKTPFGITKRKTKINVCVTFDFSNVANVAKTMVIFGLVYPLDESEKFQTHFTCFFPRARRLKNIFLCVKITQLLKKPPGNILRQSSSRLNKSRQVSSTAIFHY